MKKLFSLCAMSVLLFSCAAQGGGALNGTFFQEVRATTPQQQLERGASVLRAPASDRDRDNGTHWVCAAAFQDYPPAYLELAQFYMGIEENKKGEVVPRSIAEKDKNKFNVALGLAFLAMAKNNKTDMEIAMRAKSIYRSVLEHIGIDDAVEAQKYLYTWELYLKKMKEEGFHGLSLATYESVPCSWESSRK